MMLAGGVGSAQQQAPSCPLPPPSSPDPGTFEHRWAGLVHDSFTPDGEEVWTAEDGGRIRYRDPLLGTWSFQHVPFEVQGTIHRIHFLDNRLDGWAVSSDGHILRTSDGGQSGWSILARMPGAWGISQWERLYDVWFADNGTDGWLLGRHGIWYTLDGGVCWQKSNLFVNNTLITGNDIENVYFMTLWALDILIETGDPPAFLGIAVGQPGWILRSTDYGQNWNVVLRTYVGEVPAETCECLGPALQPGAHTPSPPFVELWDVEIATQGDSLILVGGGIGKGCGLILASTDDGLTWSREFHECHVSCGGNPPPTSPCAGNPEYDETLPPYRLQSFRTLYGVALDSADHTAIAVGYNGQHLRRELTPSGPIWRDRSSFGRPSQFLADPTLDVTVYPLYGVDLAWSGSQRRAIATGAGGHIRASTDGGETWVHENLGEPFRIFDTWFKPGDPGFEDLGWQAGQFFRLALSADGGLTWDVGSPPRVFPGTEQLNSIAFASQGERGVAVGTSIPGLTSGAPRLGPRILWTDDFGSNGWLEPTAVQYATVPGSATYEGSQLLRAVWARDAGQQHFWAVGSEGLILRTTDGGDTWQQMLLIDSTSDPNPIADHLEVELYGVAAGSPGAIVVVGCAPDGSGGRQARAWAWSGGLWSPIPVDPAALDPMHSLRDVAMVGSQVYAVGSRTLSGGEVRGVLLRYDVASGSFLPEPGPEHPAELPGCGIFGLGLEGEVLTQVELLANGDLWIAGACGQIWQRPASSGTWVEHKSQTDADARGLMFLSPTRGYLSAHGGEKTNQVLVRFTEAGQ